MISTQWIGKRKPHWLQLEQLLQRCRQSGLNTLTRPELQNMSLLYRQIASDLAVVREDASAAEFTRYLNQLLLQAHGVIYTDRKSGLKAILDFFLHSYPQIVRENLNLIAAAFGLFVVGGLMGMLLSLHSPGFALNLLGPAMMETIERGEMWTHSILAVKPLASSRIMTNNISVSFTAFAAGITGGVGTIYMMFFNGLLLGVIGTACGAAGMSLKLWSFVAPHGALELPAIFIAGGAGLGIARGMLFPGALPRKESLIRAGRQGVRLVAGVVPILVVAGVIEAFVSPTELAWSMKFAMSAGLLAMLSFWIFGGGKTTKPM
ncbi:MAG: stage II sporulation protein M [Acidobacteriota bacterium]|nr:stage II sporulation protein M [Acidobacteriota bacterium]